ncbi:MAG: beta-ketoacyl-[Treponema sp.]|nr:beta-ketoacyl-[acyl-carrier-protein] synthase II [Treponema sp.]
MARRRVVITGMGCVSPVGNNADQAWKSVKNGKSGIGPVTLFNPERLDVKIAGEVKNFCMEDYGIPSKATRKMARFSKFCLAATAQAIKDSAFSAEELKNEKCGILVGCCLGGMDAATDGFRKLDNPSFGPSRMPPLITPMMISNEAAANISIYYGLNGFSWT